MSGDNSQYETAATQRVGITYSVHKDGAIAMKELPGGVRYSCGLVRHPGWDGGTL